MANGNGILNGRVNGLIMEIIIGALLVIVTVLTTLITSSASGERKYVLRCEWETFVKRIDRMDVRDMRIEEKIDKILDRQHKTDK